MWSSDDTDGLISHGDLIEENLIKSEEFPASEHTMGTANRSSKKYGDDLQCPARTIPVR